ncbi:putative pentatricopeptide repeat-containing protein At5g37570 [Phalaenopsis equestris]|uniref:putative pentatricopeptide repeat-containing protein At5g37570 n=1 Tax=Phalaenopsis equestris TaxID=78828 RepID=UPI0009E2ED68|nr:putative pentatricopeptide repeat-containing protein At5g37570 [Phalaenopsis equestris]
MARRWSRAEEDRIASLVDLYAGTTRQLKQIHSHVVANGQSQNNFIAAKLVRTFADLGSLEHARAIADDLTSPNTFVWTALIRGYSLHPWLDNSSNHEAISLYERLHQFYPAVKPLSFTISSVLKACAQMRALGEGGQIHTHAFKHGFQLDSHVQTTLIDFYGKCGYSRDARKVFDEMYTTEPDVQAWNTMVVAYAEAGDMEAARKLFDKMPETNAHTYIAMINGYAMAGKMDLARQLLDDKSSSNEKNSVVFTALIAGYAKSGDLLAARQIFEELIDRDVASWNAMITAYIHAGLIEEAVALFHLMLDNGSRCNPQPNHTTIATIASAFAQSGSPSQANFFQAYVDRRGAELLNSHTIAALIDLHSKCGDLDKAYDLFRRWGRKDLVCYSAMIAGFGIHGCGQKAIKLFEEVQEANLKVDAICFVSLLAACSHSGMVKEGKRYFELMRTKYCITPMAEHYMCIVDLLGRAGQVEEAYSLIHGGMLIGVEPNAGVWGALLSACRSYSNVEIGEIAARCLMEIEPENAGNYVLLSNIYAKVGRWGEVASVRAVMRRRGMRKEPGWSLVETEGGRGRKFMMGEAYDLALELVLFVLSWQLKEYGYLLNMEEIEE